MNILLQVIEAFHADDKRIHMTGFSEGGFMSWRWFCQHSDLLASVAPGAAAWGCGNLANLGLTGPEIGCELSASDKPRATFPCCTCRACGTGWSIRCAPMAGSGATRSARSRSATPPWSRATRPSRRRSSCAPAIHPDGVPFEYIQHQYTSDSEFLGVPIVGHCYPGSSDLMVTPPEQTMIPPDQLMAFGCKDDCEFDWGEEVIAFFIAHPKPSRSARRRFAHAVRRRRRKQPTARATLQAWVSR